MEFTTKDYCDWLRSLGAKLASGEIEEYRMSLLDLAEKLDGDGYYKVTRGTSYSRTIINRVPEVKAVGAISIKVDETPEDKFYVFTLNRDVKRKVLTTEDVDGLKEKWRTKFIAQLLSTQPRITDLQGDELKGAAIALERFAEMIQNMKGE